MDFEKNIETAIFLNRPNRFQAYVKHKGKEIMVHVPNTGRCREILVSGTKVFIREETNPTRKTKYDLIAAYKEERLINIDSQIPNKVVEEALNSRKIPELSKYNIIQREKTFGNSRFDFKLSNLSQEYYLEVKGVTLEREGIASFPDAPTERGRKHLLELVEVIKSGRGAGVLFLVQMDTVDFFCANGEMDKAFKDALTYAFQNGVDIFAYDCIVGKTYITLKDKIKVVL